MMTSNDDDGDGLTSKISFEVEAGQTFFVLVGGYNGDQGQIALSIDTM